MGLRLAEALDEVAYIIFVFVSGCRIYNSGRLRSVQWIAQGCIGLWMYEG